MIEDVMIHKHVLELTNGVIFTKIVLMDQMKITVVSQSIVITDHTLKIHTCVLNCVYIKLSDQDFFLNVYLLNAHNGREYNTVQRV